MTRRGCDGPDDQREGLARLAVRHDVLCLARDEPDRWAAWSRTQRAPGRSLPRHARRTARRRSTCAARVGLPRIPGRRLDDCVAAAAIARDGRDRDVLVQQRSGWLSTTICLRSSSLAAIHRSAGRRWSNPSSTTLWCAGPSRPSSTMCQRLSTRRWACPRTGDYVVDPCRRNDAAPSVLLVVRDSTFGHQRELRKRDPEHPGVGLRPRFRHDRLRDLAPDQVRSGRLMIESPVERRRGRQPARSPSMSAFHLAQGVSPVSGISWNSKLMCFARWTASRSAEPHVLRPSRPSRPLVAARPRTRDPALASDTAQGPFSCVSVVGGTGLEPVTSSV